MRSVSLTAGSFRYDRVVIPQTFLERLRGKRRITAPMLFDGWSVHAIGMDRALLVVAIDRSDRVVDARPLRPGAVRVVPRARRLLELEIGSPAPAVGSRVRTYDPADGGTAGGVRHSDRKPG